MSISSRLDKIETTIQTPEATPGLIFLGSTTCSYWNDGKKLDAFAKEYDLRPDIYGAMLVVVGCPYSEAPIGHDFITVDAGCMGHRCRYYHGGDEWPTVEAEQRRLAAGGFEGKILEDGESIPATGR